jgi:hypothetical protein
MHHVMSFCNASRRVVLCMQGGESQVIAKYYTIAYKQVYDDDAGVSDWKIVDYHLDGNDQYY